MAYTDPTLSTGILIKSIHTSELVSGTTTNKNSTNSAGITTAASTAVAALVNPSAGQVIGSDKLAKLKTAINALEANYSGNCCQSTINYDCCQGCQGCQSCEACQTCQVTTCQACQTCQGCQSCQSYSTSCQTCQACEVCQSCQTTTCQSQCK